MLFSYNLLLLASLVSSVTVPLHKNAGWVIRDGTELKLEGKRFTTGGANVYWLVRRSYRCYISLNMIGAR